MEKKRMGVGFSGQKNSFLIFCFMLGFCLMLSSCYHRHSAKRQQHAALDHTKAEAGGQRGIPPV